MDDYLALQIPSFVYQHAATLVPGGGAEVVAVANSQWFLHHGFTPAAIDSSHFNSNQHQSSRHESTSSPFEFSDQTQQPQPQQEWPPPPPDFSVLLAPSPLGLPIYSQSGFDILSLLARVAHRPNPRVHLGPVDLAAAFCVVDTRRFDHPIVYCSHTFCTLTGYSEHEVLNRNCRFLQAPGGHVPKGSIRKHTSPDAVNHLRKSLLADKECQTSIINYRKDGSVFVNLVTVIPVPPLDDGEVIYHIGFQVDLNEQPSAILERLRNGTYSAPPPQSQNQVQVFLGDRRVPIQNAKGRKTHGIPPIVMSKTLRRLLGGPAFLQSISDSPLGAPSATSSTTTLTTLPDNRPNAPTMPWQHTNHPLHLMLLEAAPDFIHVVSLKGDFLYVAPSVRRVLGYEAAEMQGKGLASYAHPEDLVPLMRELKEATATGPLALAGEGIATTPAPSQPTSGSTSTGTAGAPPHPHPHLRPVDLVFRCRTKFGRYVWVEARGRLYAESGKCRRAIILAGRAREMTCLKWADVGRAGGVARGVRDAVPASGALFGSNAAVSEERTGVGPDGAGSGAGVGAVQSAGGRGVPGGLGTVTGGPGTPVCRVRAQEAWGLLAGSCARTAVFASVGRGMCDVLGWTAEDLLGRGVLRTVVAEEGLPAGHMRERERAEQGLVARSIGEAVQSMRRAQKWLREQRRLRAAGDHQGLYWHQQVPVDLARVRKVACRLRTKAGGTLECWAVVYRTDVDDDDAGSEDMNGMKHGAPVDEGADDGGRSSAVGQPYQQQVDAPLRADAGASITPAPLVFQIRIMGAETVRVPVHAASASLQGLGIPYGMPPWKTASSLAGAMPAPMSAASSSSAHPDASSPFSLAASPAAHAALTTGAGDVFAELAVARGSGWQYELQQLRIMNMRLKEELAALEAAEAALGVGSSSGKVGQQQQQAQMAMVLQPQPPQALVYAQTQPQSYTPYQPMLMYHPPQDVYQYEQPQSTGMNVNYAYPDHVQQSFFSQPPPPPPPPLPVPRLHTVSTASVSAVPLLQAQNSSSNNNNTTFLHHHQPHQPPNATATALAGDQASFHAGIRATLPNRQAQPYQPPPQPQPVAELRPVHQLPTSRVRPRPAQSSMPHPASEQIQQHILLSAGLAPPMSGHVYGQPHVRHQMQHPPPPPQQQQQQAPVPVTMPMPPSGTWWPSAMAGSYGTGASGGVMERG